MHNRYVCDQAPLRVYWETTRACDLACRHCRAEAEPQASPDELTTDEGKALLDAVAAFGEPLPHLVFTGGDPLKRKDLWELLAHAKERGIHFSVAPSATPLLTPEPIVRLKNAGTEAISLSIVGATAESHDGIRAVAGTFQTTLAAAREAVAVGLPFQVNTLVAEETVDELAAIHALVRAIGAARWSLFFLISVGRGQALQSISAQRAEELMGWLCTLRAQGGLVLPILQNRRSLDRPESSAAATASMGSLGGV